MTAEELVLTLRICGNDPRAEQMKCKDCPNLLHCENDPGNGQLLRMAADMIEALKGAE